MIVSRRSRRKAFTLIELIIVAAVIGILSSLTVINLSATRAAARDASRKESVKGYQQSIEQYRASRGTYFIYKQGTSISDLSKNAIYGDISLDTDGSGHMVMTSGVTPTGQFVGYRGGGWGRITTKSALNYPNPSLSIADVLQQDGFLSEIRQDPRASGFSTPLGNSSNPTAYNDFLLTLCAADGSQAASPQQAVEYTVFANLERPVSQPSDANDPAHLCGGAATPTGGWNTLVYGSGTSQNLAVK